MHEQMERLYSVAKDSRGISGQSALAKAMNESPQTLNNWEVRGISASGMLKAERVFGCPAAWLETGEMPPALFQVRQEIAQFVVEGIAVPLMNADASMGLGLPQPEHETVVDVIRLSKDWVHSNLKTITSPTNLAALSAYGDSMFPTFSDGDILLVDRGVSEIRLDAVYVLALRGELYIKRIQRRITDDAIIIKSDNPLYEPVVVSNGEKEGLQVLGRVVWAWNGRRL